MKRIADNIKVSKKNIFSLIYLTAMVLFATEIQAQTEEELYEKIFGNEKAALTSNLEIPLIVENRTLCYIRAIITDDPLNIELEASSFFEKATG
jgi:hypothetical protein